MKRVESPDPDVLVYRSGGLFPLIPGAVFTIFGGTSLVFATQRQRPGHAEDWVGVVVSSVFVIVGLLLLLGKRGLVLDARRKTYELWWGWIVPLRSRRGSLDEFQCITVTTETRRSKHGTFDVYPVRLSGANNARLSLSTHRSYAVSRQSAEEIAKALMLPVVDSTREEQIVRDPQHLDESLRERMRREGRPPVDLATPPAGMRSRIEVSGRTIRFHVPPPGFRRAFLVPILAVLVFETITVGLFLLPIVLGGRNALLEGPGVVVFGCFAVVFVAVPALVIGTALLRAIRTTWTVEASPERVVVEERSPFRARSRELSSDSIEDILIDSRFRFSRRKQVSQLGAPIVILGDSLVLTFGAHLSQEEKQWIRDVLAQVVSA